jgi:uncharacterized protein (UPF0276 family)
MYHILSLLVYAEINDDTYNIGWYSSTTKISLQDAAVADQLPSLVDLEVFHSTCKMVQEMQNRTRIRLTTILSYVKGCLIVFDVDE